MKNELSDLIAEKARLVDEIARLSALVNSAKYSKAYRTSEWSGLPTGKGGRSDRVGNLAAALADGDFSPALHDLIHALAAARESLFTIELQIAEFDLWQEHLKPFELSVYAARYDGQSWDYLIDSVRDQFSMKLGPAGARNALNNVNRWREIYGFPPVV